MFTARINLPVSITQEDVLHFAEMLGDEAQAHSGVRADHNEQSPWVLEWIIAEKPEAEALQARLRAIAQDNNINIAVSAQDWVIETVPDIDWLAHSYQQFPPFSVGPFYIYGAHCEGDVPEGQMGLQIDAATAFGSGEHGTTKGCLLAMLDLKGIGVCPWNVLDMGTGSGILAIAAWKLWKTPILAVDNDEECVRVSERHREANKVPSGAADMISAHGEGFAAEIAQKKAPYELVIANILAGPLKEMAADLKSVVDDNGYVILSGILIEQAQSVIDIYEAQGLSMKKRYEVGEWATLVLNNPG